jgi:hypothetical protein
MTPEPASVGRYRIRLPHDGASGRVVGIGAPPQDCCDSVGDIVPKVWFSVFHEDACVRIVYRAENIIDANLVKNALAFEGIDAYVSGEYLTGAVGELPVWNLVSVMVADHDIERAAPVVEAVDSGLREVRKIEDDPLGDALPAF